MLPDFLFSILFFSYFACNIINVLFPGIFEIPIKTGKQYGNETEIKKSVSIKFLEILA